MANSEELKIIEKKVAALDDSLNKLRDASLESHKFVMTQLFTVMAVVVNPSN